MDANATTMAEKLSVDMYATVGRRSEIRIEIKTEIRTDP